MIDSTRALALIGPFEGRIPHMYLDTTGHVTVGVGNLLATPQTAIELIWYHRTGGAEASPVEISDEWQRMHGAVPGMAASAYQPITALVLLDDEIGRLFNRRVAEFEAQLEHVYPLFPEWPDEAQLATLDMAFNLGVAALPLRWPHLSDALRSMDWRAAAVQSHRPQSREERNQAVRDLYLAAARAGAIPAFEVA